MNLDKLSKIIYEAFNRNAIEFLGIYEILAILSITFILSLIVLLVYKKSYSGVAYNQRFNVSLVGISLITTTIVLTIGSNIVVSLGLVGALSIVRFRTAIKEPLDMTFTYWVIGIGITTGAGLFHVSIISTIVISIVLLVLTRFKNSNNIYLLIIHYNKQNAFKENIFEKLDDVNYTLKAKTVTNETVELVVEVRLLNKTTEFLDELTEIQGVIDAHLVNYNGDFAF